MITESQRQLIDETLDRFDANKVAKVMELLEWEWWDAEEGTPQPHEIRKKARWLLEEGFRWLNKNNADGSFSGKEYKTGTGGLWVGIQTFEEDVDPDGNVYVTLYFAAEMSEFDGEWLNEEPSW